MRTTRKADLTRRGSLLRTEADRTLAGLRRRADRFRLDAAAARSRVVVAATPMVAATMLPDVIRSHGERYPGVEIQVRDLRHGDALQAIAGGDADVAVVAFDGKDKRFRSQALRIEDMVLIVPPHRTLARPGHCIIQVGTSERLRYAPAPPARRPIRRSAEEVPIFRNTNSGLVCGRVSSAGLGRAIARTLSDKQIEARMKWLLGFAIVAGLPMIAAAAEPYAKCKVTTIDAKSVEYVPVPERASAGCDTGGGGLKSCSVVVPPTAGMVLDPDVHSVECVRLGGHNPCAFVRPSGDRPIIGRDGNATRTFATDSDRVHVIQYVGQKKIVTSLKPAVETTLDIFKGPNPFFIKRPKTAASVSLECEKNTLGGVVSEKLGSPQLVFVRKDSDDVFDFYYYVVAER